MGKEKVKLPVFLKDVTIQEDRRRMYREVLSNWMNVHEHIRHLKPDDDSIMFLKRLMVMEFQREGGPRMDIVVRLHGKMHVLRHEVERVQLRA